MAAPMSEKRAREKSGIDGQYEDCKVDEEKDSKKKLQTDCHRFLEWCEGKGVIINAKVTVRRLGSCAQCGMIALEDVKKGETLFAVPRPALLHPGNCHVTLARYLQEDKGSLQSDSGWVPLILAVMYESTDQDSKWRHYLDLFPDYTELDSPMFWDSSLLQRELKGTGIPEAVERDGKNIEEEYNNIALPFMKKHSDLFSLEKHTMELYRRIVSFVMAYSFTEPDEEDDDDGGFRAGDEDTIRRSKRSAPMMVPLADALNHIAKNNAHLRFGTESLDMVATQDIKAGSEVFNTYGELANAELLHMYGFAEQFPENIYDTVDIPHEALLREARRLQAGDETLGDKWDFLKTVGVVSEDEAFVIGMDGVLTDEELQTALKVLTLEKDAYIKYREDDGWASDDETDDLFTNDELCNLPSSWRKLLSSTARSCLSNSAALHPGDETLVNDAERVAELTSRSRRAFCVRLGHRKILERLVESCKVDG